MSEQERGRTHRNDLGYLSAVAAAIVGGITYAGPWGGYWEVAGLGLFITGAVLWALWEVLFHD